MLLFLFGSLSLKQLFMIQRICIAAYDLESFRKKKKTDNDTNENDFIFLRRSIHIS